MKPFARKPISKLLKGTGFMNWIMCKPGSLISMTFFASQIYSLNLYSNTNVAFITSIITISIMFVVDEYETTTEVIKKEKNYYQQSTITITTNSMILFKKDVKHVLPRSLI